MSTPIRQVEISPENPKFYAPPRLRRGEVEAPSIQPSRGRLSCRVRKLMPNGRLIMAMKSWQMNVRFR
jgi:hypothetical protein